MSIDIKLQNRCDHLINWERVELNTDRRSIYPSYLIAATASFQLRINNTVKVRSTYDFANTFETTVVAPTVFIRMVNKVDLYRPLVEMLYTTTADHCPKCVGVKYVDDVVYTKKGDITTAHSEHLLVQNVEKRIITELGSNTFHTDIGTGLHSLVNSKMVNFDLMRSRVIEQITISLDRFRRAQQDLVSSGRSVSSGELFGELLEIQVQQAEDPTILLVTVSFTAQSGKTLEYSQFLELSRQRVAYV